MQNYRIINVFHICLQIWQNFWTPNDSKVSSYRRHIHRFVYIVNFLFIANDYPNGIYLSKDTWPKTFFKELRTCVVFDKIYLVVNLHADIPGYNEAMEGGVLIHTHVLSKHKKGTGPVLWVGQSQMHRNDTQTKHKYVS